MNKWRRMHRAVSLLTAFIIVFLLSAVFIVTPLSAADGDSYYWSGGTGDWSDVTHWSSTDDGTGGDYATAPNNTNPVYFATQAFTGAGQTVTVTAGATCKSMDWTGATNNPTLARGANPISVYGDVIFIAAMSTTGSDYALYVKAACILRTNGMNLNGGINIFPNLGNSLTLADDLNCSQAAAGTIAFQRGTFTTNNHNIICAQFVSSYAIAKTLTLGSSTIYCTDWITDTTTTLTANTATINCTGAFTGGARTTYNTVNIQGLTSTISDNNTLSSLALSPLPQIYCMGDSLTNWGYYETRLNGLLGTHNWIVVNKGVSGNTVIQMAARFTADILNHYPNYTIIWGGTNDVSGGTSAATIESNLQAMYTAAHNAGIRVIALTISPRGGLTVPQRTVLNTVNAWILSTPSGVDYVVDDYAVLDDPANPGFLLPAYDSGDGLHLTVAGYNIVADTIYAGVAFSTANGGGQIATFTGNTMQTVSALSRNGTSPITMQSSNTTAWYIVDTAGANSLANTTLSRSNASGGATFNATGASKDNGNNSGWNFTHAVTSSAATGIAMNKDGVTSGNFNGNLTDMGGQDNTALFEYGLTVAYGSNTSTASLTTTGAYSKAIPNNLTPGATYHFRASSTNGSTTVTGADQSFTLTMPTVSTVGSSGSATAGNWDKVTLTGNISNMGKATTTYGRFKWGYTPTMGNTTPNQTINAPGDVTVQLTSLTGNSTIYYLFEVANGAVTTDGSQRTYLVPAYSDIFTGLSPVIRMAPTLFVLGFIVAGFFLMIAGAKRRDIPGIIMLGIGIVFLGIAALFMPVMISAFTSVLTGV